jgi:hypothetical protein
MMRQKSVLIVIAFMLALTAAVLGVTFYLSVRILSPGLSYQQLPK